MSTRDSLDNFLQQCTDALDYAKEQYATAQKQEHYNDLDYLKAQQILEGTYNDLIKFTHSCNEQQRHQLYLMRNQVLEMQSQLINR